MTRQYVEELREEFGDLVLDIMNTDVNVSYAQSEQLTIFEYEAEHKTKTRAAADFRRLAQRFLPAADAVNVAVLEVAGDG